MEKENGQTFLQEDTTGEGKVILEKEKPGGTKESLLREARPLSSIVTIHLLRTLLVHCWGTDTVQQKPAVTFWKFIS
jgi:hypothetical protein